MPPVKQVTERTQLYLPPKLKRALERQARSEHTSLNALIVRTLLASALTRGGKE